MSPTIEAEALTKRFGRVVAVDRLDLALQGPGLVGLLGPNGAGKTTTMRLLTAFLALSSGTARVAGYDVFEDPIEVKRRVGYLPESPPLYPELRVGTYLRFVAEIREVPRQRRLARIGQVMEQTGLTGWERVPTGALSKGYRQRVGLASALLHDPPVIILDEPTSGLDPLQLPGIRGLVRELAKDRLVLLSTHVLAEVEELCDRVVILHQGRIAGDGTLAQLADAAGIHRWWDVSLASAADLSGALSRASSVRRVVPLGPGRYRVEGDASIPADVHRLAVAENAVVTSLTLREPQLSETFATLVERMASA